MLMNSLKYDQVSDLWQQLELASEFESDLWDNVEWGRILFDLPNNTGAIDMKMDRSVLKEK